MPNNINEEREEQPDEAPANEHALEIPDPKVANFDLTVHYNPTDLSPNQDKVRRTTH